MMMVVAIASQAVVAVLHVGQKHRMRHEGAGVSIAETVKAEVGSMIGVRVCARVAKFPRLDEIIEDVIMAMWQEIVKHSWRILESRGRPYYSCGLEVPW